MKLKKVVKVASATAVLTSMLVMPVFAAEETPWNVNGASATVEGTSYVVEPTIEVELPGELAFGVNPLMLNVAEEAEEGDETPTPITSQIISGNYLVTNFSNVPVAVTAATTITASEDVKLLTATETKTAGTTGSGFWDKNNELKSVTGKKAVWFVQLYPTAIDKDTGEMTVTPVTAGTSTSASVLGDTVTDTALTKPVIFVLDAYDEANADKSMAGFKFDGAVDPNAVFTEDDLKVSTVYTLNVITDAQKSNNYAGYSTNDGATGVTKKFADGDVVSTIKGLSTK